MFMMRIGIRALPASRFLLAVFALAPRWAQPQGGDPLGPEFRINTYTPENQSEPRVAVDSSGNFVVVWSSYKQDSSLHGVFGQRYASDGAARGGEFRVNTYTTAAQYVADVAVDASGNFVVVWTSQFQDGSERGVFGQRYAISGVPLGPEFRVNTYTADFQGGPAAAADARGDFVVTWGSYNQLGGQLTDMFGQRYASTGAPAGPEFRINTYTTGFQGGRAVAFDGTGAFIVVWLSKPQDGSDLGVFGQRFANSGTPLGPEFRVNTYTTSFQRYPAVAADAVGNFVVVWESAMAGGSGIGIFGQRFASSGVPVGVEFRINSYVTGLVFRPSVAADPSGNFVVVWRDLGQDGSIGGIFGQRYGNSGSPLGPEFRVNTYTTNYQRYPCVTADASGGFVVVWDSDTQDGSGFGIFGQRYSQIVPVELIGFRVE
jgi:hypothetical protein